ncbi:MAG TPA: hypothetical protein VF765_05540 [Polyangiaceae bacterium]
MATSAAASGAVVSNRPSALDELQAAAPHAPAATTSTAKVAGMARRQNGSIERMIQPSSGNTHAEDTTSKNTARREAATCHLMPGVIARALV